MYSGGGDFTKTLMSVVVKELPNSLIIQFRFIVIMQSKFILLCVGKWLINSQFLHPHQISCYLIILMPVYRDVCNYVSDYVFRLHDLKPFSQ